MTADPARRPLDSLALALMLLLCLTWALQQILVKAVAADAAPLLQIGLRSAVSVLLVAALMALQGQRPDWRRHGRAGLLVGTLFGVEFLLVAEALRLTTAAHTVVFLYTAPMFAAIGLHFRVAAERLRPRQWLGIVLAFAGIAWAFLRAPATSGAGVSLAGDLLALAAGAAWGATTIAIRGSRLAQAPASEALLYQLTGAAVLLLAAAAITGQTALRPTPALLWSLAFQSVVVSFASFLVWFWLLRRHVAATLGVFTFMTPLFGVALGVLLLGEPLEPAFVQGAVLVLAGMLLVSAPPALVRRWVLQRRG